MRSDFRKKWDELNLKVESRYREYVYRKKGKIRLKRMNGGFKCNTEYREIVLPYWKRFGYKPQKMWYQIFADRDKKVDPRYIPDDLWFGTIIPYYSNPLFRRGGEDKCYHDVWFSNLKRPETLAKNIAGVFYDSQMNVISFEDVIDILGGVDINLTAAEAKIIGDGAHEGISHLDGDHALMYARIRKLDSDFGRTERQRNIVNAVFKKVKNCSVRELLDLVDTVLPYLSTDMSNIQIASIAMKYAPKLATLEVSTHHVPADGTYKDAMIRGMAVLVPDLYEVKKDLFEEFLPF